MDSEFFLPEDPEWSFCPACDEHRGERGLCWRCGCPVSPASDEGADPPATPTDVRL